MKQYICLFLSVCIILTFAACTQSPDSTQGPSAVQTMASQVQTTPTTSPPETTLQQEPSAIYEAPMIAVSLPLLVQSKKDDGGKEIAYYTHQDVFITLPDADVAQIVTLDLLNRIDHATVSAEALMNAAQENYNGQDDWSAYAYTVTYAPARIDENVMSFLGTETSYDGSSRASHSSVSVNYDLTTGEALSLRGIFHEENFADALCDMIISGLKPKAEELYGDYESIVREMFTTNTPINNWYFTAEGLCFFFSPYEIAPYTAGTIVSTIPYENLSGLLKDAYFPGEQFSYNGALVATLLDGDVPEILSQFAELKLDNSGERILITADGSVSNIQIYYNTGSEYAEDTVVLSMVGMGPTDAIIIELATDSAADHIKVSFDAQGATQTLELTKDENGNLILAN